MTPGKYDHIYRRDGWQCRHCKARSQLTPHHYIYRSAQGSDDENNLITLCVQCHNAHHDGFLQIDLVRLEEHDLLVHFTRLRGWRPR